MTTDSRILYKWKLYRFLLFANITLAGLALIFFWYGAIVLRIPANSFNIILTLVGIYIIIRTIYCLRIVSVQLSHKKQSIIKEGTVYTLNVTVAISCLYIFLYVITIFDSIFEKYDFSFELFKAPVFMSMFFFLCLAFLTIIDLILSFHLLSAKNRKKITVFDEIDSIGEKV